MSLTKVSCRNLLLPKSHQFFSPPRSSPRPALSPGSTGDARIVQTFPPTHAKAVSPLHSFGKTFASHPFVRAPAQHPLRPADASKRKAAPSPKHPQSPLPAAPAAPDSSISPAAAAPPPH